MPTRASNVLDIVLIGTGISGLNFIDKYLENKKTLHVISPPDIEKKLFKIKHKLKLLPSQMRGKRTIIENYLSANQLNLSGDCRALGALNFGGLSNYWGLQIDNYFVNDQKNFNKKELKLLKRNFFEFVKKFRLLGKFNDYNLNYFYSNDFKISENFNNLLKKKKSQFNCRKPILAFSKKNFSGNLNSIIENKDKLNAHNLFKKINKKKNLVFHKCYVENIKKKGDIIELACKNAGKNKIIKAKKVVFACGTIATTKIIMKFLNIKHEVKIKHHPRLLSVYFSKKRIKSNLSFTPSLIQLVNKSNKDLFTADLRPGNKLITESIIDAFPYMKIFRGLINFFRHRLIFSNLLADSSNSNIFLKKNKNGYDLYSKNVNLKSILRLKNKKVFNFLNKEGIIFPFYKTFFPGSGADYHYFGSIPFKKKGKLSVNNKCQLRSYNNIFILDGSVFDFKSNKYPLGIVAANARRVANLLSS